MFASRLEKQRVSKVNQNKSSMLGELTVLCAHILFEQRTEEVLSRPCSQGLFIVTICFSSTPKSFQGCFSEPHQVTPLKLLSAQQWTSDNSLPEIRVERERKTQDSCGHSVYVHECVCVSLSMSTCVCPVSAWGGDEWESDPRGITSPQRWLPLPSSLSPQTRWRKSKVKANPP